MLTKNINKIIGINKISESLVERISENILKNAGNHTGKYLASIG
jgi:hypothetical protein